MTLGLAISAGIVLVVAFCAAVAGLRARRAARAPELTLRQRRRIASHLYVVNGGRR